MQTCNHYTVDARIQWRQKLSGASHPHWRPICWGSVWKRHCAHSLAQWDVATPAPNWSLSPLSRLHSLICICHVCQKEKTPQWEHDESKKKWASDINLLPCGFCMTVINCLFVWTPSFRRRSQQTHPAQFSCMVILWCTWSFCAYMPERVYILAVMLSCNKIWSQEPIVIIPSWWQIRPSPLVVIAALHELHQLLWLAEPLTVRVGVSIWVLSAPIRAGTKTAAQHVYHRAAHSTKGCKKYTESMWEGLSVIHSFSIRLCCSWHKWTCSQTTRNAHWSSSTSQTSHLLLLVGQDVKEAKGHVDRYNLCSLALVQSSLFLCATFMPQIDF